MLVFSKVIESKPFDLPQGGRLLTCAKSIEAAMKSETTADARRACTEFLDAASEFYKAPACGIRVLAARAVASPRKLEQGAFWGLPPPERPEQALP